MWKKYGRISVMFCLFFLVFGLGVFLPDRLFAIADKKKAAETELDNATPLVVPDAGQAAIEKKLHFLYPEDDMPPLHFFSLPFDTEELKQIEKVITREIKNLQKYKLFPKGATHKSFFLDKYYILDTSETGDFLIMWFVWEQGAENEVLQFWIEAETEKIMAINFDSEKKHNWKSAKKFFRKYLRKELSIDAKDIPKFSFFYNSFGYAITSESFLAYQQTQGFSDFAHNSSQYTNEVTDVSDGKDVKVY